MSKNIKIILISLASLILLAVLIYQIPYVRSVVSWRIEKFLIYSKNVIDPIGPVPTALPVTAQPITPTRTQVNTPMVDLLPTVTPAGTFPPLPAQFKLPSPPYQKQTANNCGPAALSMALTKRPVGLLVWGGKHAWVMTGFTSDADPRIHPDRKKKRDFTSSRAIIDACKPFYWMKEFPPTSTISRQDFQETLRKWGSVLTRTK